MRALLGGVVVACSSNSAVISLSRRPMASEAWFKPSAIMGRISAKLNWLNIGAKILFAMIIPLILLRA